MAGREDDPFRRVLRGLVGEVPGAWGAIFVDWEGEAVELFATNDEYEVKLAGAHTGLLLTRLVSSGKDASLGRTTSFHLRTEDAAYFLHTLDEEYFVLLAASPRTPAGVARHRLLRAVSALRAHL
jgi:predicted regulator of Ras-like GTPase activity (Roadblock/LC7/MglB family)